MQFPGDRVAYLVSHAAFHALAKTNPPPLMAYRHRDFICFICFLVEGATSAHANTKDEQADTDNQSDFSGAFPFPLFPS